MMATRTAPSSPIAAPRFARSTRRSPSRRKTPVAAALSRFNRRPGFASRPSADLAGRSVAISIDVPAAFDATLAPHHKVLGRWVAAREEAGILYTRPAARARIEQVFGDTVAEILKPFELADLIVVALVGDDALPPALAIICQSIGQLELGWIEKSNVLSNTMFGNVAPVGWRAAAYRALEETLGIALPFFGFDDMIEELSAYHWEGETDDAGASRAMMELYGDEDIDESMLPSAVRARRPDWMKAKPAPLKDMPPALRGALARLRDTHRALRATVRPGSAWHADRDEEEYYLPDRQDGSHLPPLTLVPFDHFAREIDDVGRFGMEQGFSDVIGLCAVPNADAVEAWFETLRLGADFLLAAQALINLDPANPVKP